MQEVCFPVTAATKTWLGRDLAGVSDATQEQFHLESHWWGGTATVRHCVGDGRFQKLDSSQNTTSHLRARKKNKTRSLPNMHLPSLLPPSLSPPSFPSTASQPLARRQEETWGTAHNSARSATRERAQKIQTTFNSCYWTLIGFGCQRGLPIIRRCDFFFCLTDHETSSSIEEQIHPLRKKKQKNTKIKPLLL